MIPYASIATAVKAALDSEIGNYYDDLIDIIPALNLAQDTILSTINSKIGTKKFLEEFSRSLVQNRIYQTSNYSRILLDVPSSGIKVWSVMSVTVNPVVALPPAAASAYVPITTPNSAINLAYVYVGGGSGCRRLNSQEWGSNANNPLLDGFVSQNPNPQNIGYAYLSHVDYMSDLFPSIPYEISIRPNIPNAPVAVTFIGYPNRIVSTSDSLLWDVTIQGLLVDATLWNLGYKQGDKSTVWQMSQEQLSEFLTSMT